MKIRAASSILLSSSLLFTLVATPAVAGHESWYFGTGFEVGGIHFRIGYAESGPFGSSFYFEAGQPFRYPGYACSNRCYRRGPHDYHHPSCRAVHHHFGLYGYAPGYFFEYYGPPVPYPPPYSYYGGTDPYCCSPPVYYYGAPQWWFGYFGHFDKYRKPKYYGHHQDRWRYEKYYYPRDRGRYERQDQDRQGRPPATQYDRDRHERDRGQRYERRPDDRSRQNRGSFERKPSGQKPPHD